MSTFKTKHAFDSSSKYLSNDVFRLEFCGWLKFINFLVFLLHSIDVLRLAVSLFMVLNFFIFEMYCSFSLIERSSPIFGCALRLSLQQRKALSSAHHQAIYSLVPVQLCLPHWTLQVHTQYTHIQLYTHTILQRSNWFDFWVQKVDKSGSKCS